MSRKQVKEDPKRGAPAYIVTFSDMATNLLTFFVLLISMAETRITDHNYSDVHRPREAQGVFNTQGKKGTLLSDALMAAFEQKKVKYKVPQQASEQKQTMQNPSKDAHMEMLRRIVMDVEKMMTITPPAITGQTKSYTPTPIRFSPGGWELNASAKHYLNEYVQEMVENLRQEVVTIYIVGIASSEADEKRQWKISSQRAQSVRDYIQSRLPKNSRWSVYCWGAGPGGDWTGKTGVTTDKVEILIAELTKK